MTSAAWPDSAMRPTNATTTKETPVDRPLRRAMLKIAAPPPNFSIEQGTARSTSDAIRFTRNLCSGSRAGCVGASDTPAATVGSTIIGGWDAFRSVRLFRSSRALLKDLPTSRRDVPTYGEPAGEAAGDGAGVPKLKFTVGAFSAPGCAAKNGRGAKPNMPAIKLVGKLRTVVL